MNNRYICLMMKSKKKCFMIRMMHMIKNLKKRYIMSIGRTFGRMFRKKHHIQQENPRVLQKVNRWQLVIQVSVWVLVHQEHKILSNLGTHTEPPLEELQVQLGASFNEALDLAKNQVLELISQIQLSPQCIKRLSKLLLVQK